MKYIEPRDRKQAENARLFYRCGYSVLMYSLATFVTAASSACLRGRRSLLCLLVHASGLGWVEMASTMANLLYLVTRHKFNSLLRANSKKVLAPSRLPIGKNATYTRKFKLLQTQTLYIYTIQPPHFLDRGLFIPLHTKYSRCSNLFQCGKFRLLARWRVASVLVAQPRQQFGLGRNGPHAG